jgi:hypothetical protein
MYLLIRRYVFFLPNYFFFFIALYKKYAKPPYRTTDPKINIIRAEIGKLIYFPPSL